MLLGVEAKKRMDVRRGSQVKEGKMVCYVNLCGEQAVSFHIEFKESVGKNFTP